MAHALAGKGYEHLLPVRRLRRLWSDRVKEIECPLFPGYLFCRMDPLLRLPVLTTPGVLSIVGTGRTPVPVEPREIKVVQQLVASGLDAEPVPFLRVGEHVRIVRGPLAGIEGVLVELRQRRRLVVSVTLLQRSVAVDLAEDWVWPVDADGSWHARRRAV